MKLYIPLPDRKPWFDTAEQEIPESDYELIFRNIEMEPFDEALEVGESFEEGEPLEGPTKDLIPPLRKLSPDPEHDAS